MYRSRRGQMSLIMILMVALALIFYAIAVNWSRIATTKASATVASNTGASKMVSSMASYGEYLIQTQLGGVVKKCSGTSMLVSIIVLIVLIIVIVVVSLFSYGAGGAAAWGAAGVGMTTAFAVAAGLAIVMTIASIILQATVIQPGIGKQWNKWQQGLSTAEDQYLEQGLQTALTAIISDPVNVADRWDLDMDGRWWSPELNGGQGGGTNKTEKVARFSYYYTDRMKNILVTSDNAKVKKLQKILQGISVDLGLYSVNPGGIAPICYNGGVLRPECNPCCIERTIRPEGCYVDERTQDDRDNGVKAWERPLPNGIPVVHPGCNTANDYDPLYEAHNTLPTDPVGGPLFNNTLVKAIGLDDGQSSGAPPGLFDATESTPGSVYRLLWSLADSQPESNAVNSSVAMSDPGCHWCSSPTGAATCTPLTDNLYRPTNVPDPVTGWVSPFFGRMNQPSYAPCIGDNCCTSFFASDIANLAISSGIRMDKVGAIRALEPTPVAECAVDAAGINTAINNDAPTNAWKKGADYKQATFVDASGGTYPIKMNTNPTAPTLGGLIASCSEGAAVEACRCSAADAPKPYWHDDLFDMMTNQFATYKQAADVIINAKTGKERKALGANPDGWGQSLIDEAANLALWQTNIQTWSTSMNQWMFGPKAGITYEDDGQWCVPVKADAMSFGMSTDEFNAINASGWGNVNSVITCLDINVNNADKFSTCSTGIQALANKVTDPEQLAAGFGGRFKCSMATDCLQMPRSLLTLASGGTFMPNDDGNKCETKNYPCIKMVWDPAGCLEWDVRAIAGACPFTCPNAACGAACLAPDTCANPACTAGCDATSGACMQNYQKPVGCYVPTPSTCFVDLWKKTATMDYLDNINKSYTLAARQTAKFQKRSDYLKTVRSEVSDASPSSFKSIIDAASSYLSVIKDPDTNLNLGDAATAITNLVNSIMADTIGANELSLGNKIIYGWVSPRPEKWGNSARTYGYLHIVSVEAVLPKRSTGVYDIGISTCPGLNNNKFQWVKTTKHNWGTKRCYELQEKSGCVGLRVTRYDEDHDPAQGGIMRFLSGLPLWQIVYHNPHSGGIDYNDAAIGGTANNPHKDIVDNCFDAHYSRRAFVSGVGSLYKKLVEIDPDNAATKAGGFPAATDPDLTKAFMLSLPYDTVAMANSSGEANQKLSLCKSAAERRLERGVFSETCAKYYTVGNQTRMGFRRCSDCCTSPNN
ncbi:MAG: hypothetical protein HQL17_08620 [Candidatus Omnitrophica bacterium]|nr:hypothetical protein [Candidatus Omnitrophota bacterium]